ncbi:uncharacterized protein LOC114244025 [Bombyx mandarina]|uniref:Cuticle protein n=2 Tax=Bombyx TaxID=7090 RepID=A0A8R1WLL5_BOMMO|nr:uncharacterized protein LOC101746215 [Bombyx mori]XP_028031513.1 uncharacterized protein LOC114244025 [Bombyx mandarina]
MKVMYAFVMMSCALLVQAYPYNPYYGNVDSLSYGSGDSNRGGLVMSRYYNPYYNPRAVGGGMAAFMYRQPEAAQAPSTGQVYIPDRRRQTLADTSYVPQQENEVYYPQQPENPIFSPTQATELADPTEKIELYSTTLVPVAKATEAPAAPELPEPEVLEVEEPKAKKAVANKKKQAKRPLEEDEEEDDFAPPRVPTSAFFPMFFGWGGRAAGGPGGPTAVANAYSTGRGGVATSHATAYGGPRPDEKL